MGEIDVANRGKRGLIIAIDGPAGVGKSTVARLLALRLGYLYLDTGALYRAIAWKVHNTGLSPDDHQAIAALLPKTTLQMACGPEQSHVLLNGRDITGELRTPEVTALASMVSAIPAVREWLLPVQRQIGAEGCVVAEGRDIGTRVFPEADVKFFSRPMQKSEPPDGIANWWRRGTRFNLIRPSATSPGVMIVTVPARWRR